MNTMIQIFAQQAQELLKNEMVAQRLSELKSEEERQQWLAIAVCHALAKTNSK